MGSQLDLLYAVLKAKGLIGSHAWGARRDFRGAQCWSISSCSGDRGCDAAPAAPRVPQRGRKPRDVMRGW